MRGTPSRTVTSALALAGLLLACVGLPGESQTRTALSGVVLRDGTGDALSGASISLVEPRLETRSDEHGAFSFPSLPPGEYTLQVTMPAHVSLVESLSLVGSQHLQLSLAPIVGILDEILAVVEGSGSHDLIEVPRGTPGSVADVIADRSPWLDLRRNGSAAGGASLRVRGVNSLSLTNEPIVLVDGIRIAASSEGRHALEMIPASFVRRVRILRGPSAQFPDASNGVISIETVESGGMDHREAPSN